MPKHNFTIRMDDKIRERLDRAADIENRTSSNLGEKIIKEWLDANFPEKNNEENANQDNDL